MTLGQKIVALALIATTSVFANSSIETLIEEFNNTVDEEKKIELKQKIDQELSMMNESDRIILSEKIKIDEPAEK